MFECSQHAKGMAVFFRVHRVGEDKPLLWFLGFDKVALIQGRGLEGSCRLLGRLLQAFVMIFRVGERGQRSWAKDGDGRASLPSHVLTEEGRGGEWDFERTHLEIF